MEKQMPIRSGTKIVTDEICSYGCGNIAHYSTSSGKLSCDIVPNKCPAVRAKNSASTKNAYESGKRVSAKERYVTLPEDSKQKMAWAKGLTKDTHDSIRSWATNMTDKRKISDEQILRKVMYKEDCSFHLSSCIEKVKGYSILQERGMYHKNINPTGVVRDHRISVHYGFINNIDPKIISHPANCEFVLHSANAKKTWKNSCTVDELMKDIQEWDSCTGGETADAVS